MNIRKFIRQRMKEVLAENYPAGAENDPNAPWNRPDPSYSSVAEPENKEFSTVAVIPGELAILKDDKGAKYAFYFNHLDTSDFEPYAQREIINTYKGEDGPEHDYSDDWEVDSYVIDNYVNDNAPHMSRGIGINGWENGINIVLIDDALKAELLNTYGKDSNLKLALS